MKLDICDVCLSEGKLVKSKYTIGFPKELKMDVCEEHKQYEPNLDKEAFCKKVLKLLLKNAEDDKANKLLK